MAERREVILQWVPGSCPLQDRGEWEHERRGETSGRPALGRPLATRAVHCAALLLLLLLLFPPAALPRCSRAALEVPHGGRQGRHLSVVADVFRARENRPVPPETPAHEGRAPEEEVPGRVGLLPAHGAPARRTVRAQSGHWRQSSEEFRPIRWRYWREPDQWPARSWWTSTADDLNWALGEDP